MTLMNAPTFVLLLFLSSLARGQSPAQTLPLWTENPPTDNGLRGADTDGVWGCIGNVATAELTVYLPEAKKATGAAIVLIPGGGYQVICAKGEGHEMAELLISHGVAAIVLKYRLPNQHREVPAEDARRAIRTTRHHAADWRIDPDRVGVWGFSAGGHLASTVSTKFDQGDPKSDDVIRHQSSRPDFSILFYPVISMKTGITHGGSRLHLLGPSPTEALVNAYCMDTQVTKQTPPTLMLHAADDKVVPLENTLLYYRQLVAQGVSARLMVYETGGHGPEAFKGNPTWLAVFKDWLSKR